MKICNIFSAGEQDCTSADVRRAHMNIAADKGFLLASALGVTPDIVVGDFDSLGEPPENLRIIRHPVQKDDTDTMLAVRTALSCGCDTFYLYGCTGGRLDHTLANLQTLHFIADNGGRGVIVGKQCAAVVKNGSLSFAENAEGYISVFALAGKAEGVTLKGLFYPLENAELLSDFPLGTSNEFIGKRAEISVKNGYLTVLWSCGINCLEVAENKIFDKIG